MTRKFLTATERDLSPEEIRDWMRERADRAEIVEDMLWPIVGIGFYATVILVLIWWTH